MTNEKTPLLKITNSSGFPFQLGVKTEIHEHVQSHGWEILVEEHRWSHPELSNMGYVDLVLKHRLQSIARLVVECKKVTNTDWIFLKPKDESEVRTTASAFWTSRREENQDVWGWADLALEPSSPVSAFCVVKGQGNKNPMLEHVADSLLPALESVAIQEMRLCGHHSIETPAMYLPVIITNARLRICEFSPEDISLETGELTDGDFEEVPLVRFRKTLGTQMSGTRLPRDLKEANRFEQCTVLVINASSLVATLSAIEISSDYGSGIMNLIKHERNRKHGAPGMGSEHR